MSFKSYFGVNIETISELRIVTNDEKKYLYIRIKDDGLLEYHYSSIQREHMHDTIPYLSLRCLRVSEIPIINRMYYEDNGELYYLSINGNREKAIKKDYEIISAFIEDRTKREIEQKLMVKIWNKESD